MNFCKHLLLVTLVFFGLANAQAQRSGLVKGKVIDQGTEAPLSFATVSLYTVADSALVTGGVTDDQGIFAIEIQPGSYYAEITFLSYRKQVIENVNITPEKRTVELGTIGLASDAATLTEVEVRAEKSRMQMSLDKRVFNVGKDLANNGGNASEVLDNIPSVAVDVEGNVSLRGSGGVRILINGRPSGLVGIGDTDGLRQIPANLIERVEIVTNPSARYEAEGMAGVINIILKKEKKQGINGAFDVTAGYPDRYGVSANLNYRRNDLNFFVNYGINYRESPGGGFTFQEFTDSDGVLRFSEQDRDRKRTGLSNSVRAGLDYYFSENTTLTSSFIYRHGDDENFSEIEYRDYVESLDNLTGIAVRRDEEEEIEPSLEYAATLRHNFGKKDHDLVVDFRWQDNTETEKSNIREQFFTPEFTDTGEPDLLQRTLNEEIQRQIITQIDYTLPFGEGGKFEAGLRGSFRDIANEYLVEEFNMTSWEALAGLSNDFNYNEDIYAAYGIFGNKFGDFSFQVGFRAEYSDIVTELLQTNEVNARDYFNLFPSAFLGYELGENNSLQVSYSRRINRPRFWDLNPFFSFSDARNFRSGNPNLDPEFTDSYEISHLKYWDKASLSSSLYYRYTTGVIDRIQTFDQEGNTISQPQNLATEDAFGMEFTFSYEPFKWWDLDGSVNFYRSIVDGGNLAPNLEADFYSWFTRVNSQFDLWETINGQIRLNYRAPRRTTQGRNKAIYYMDLAMSKDILKDKGTLTLSVRDVFNSRKRRFITDVPGFFREGDFQWRARQAMLTFSYRLNQQKKRDRGGRRGGGGYR